MTLKEKYTIKNKKRIKQFIFIYSILVIFFAAYTTLAKYEMSAEGHTKITLADWKISLNGKEITNNNDTLTDLITLKDSNNSSKIKPGQTGYFDIEINPTGTEVSFMYKVSLDLTNSILPKGLKITKYSLDENITKNDLPLDNSISNTVLLDNKEIFTSEDIQKIRFYWEWDSGDEGDSAYTVITKIELKQVL